MKCVLIFVVISKPLTFERTLILVRSLALAAFLAKCFLFLVSEGFE